MFKCYDQSKIENYIFKCDQCKLPFDQFSPSISDLESSSCIKTFFDITELNRIKICVVKNASGNKILSGSNNGSIQIWNSETSECINTIDAHSKTITNIELLSNERLISCSHDKTIKLFDLNTLNFIKTFIGHEDSILGIEKLSDDTIVSCSLDETIRVWNLNSGQCSKILNEYTKITCFKVFSEKKNFKWLL